MADGDVVRKITITATGENIDRTTDSVKSLGDATAKTSAANDTAKQSAASAGSVWVDYAAKLYLAKSAYDAVTSSTDATTSSIGRLTNSVSNGAKSNELTGLFAAFNSVWQEGIDKQTKYIALNEKAGSIGVDFYQRMTIAATSAQKPADDYLKIIENINKALDRKLGSNGVQNGSAFNTLTTELQLNGNLQGQTGDINRVNNAVTSQEQLQSGLALIKGALEAGEKLTAFKIADTILGPQATENLKKDNDYIYQIEQSIKNVKDSEIIKQADIDRAVAMKTEMDNAKKIIDSWFTGPVKSDWSALGIGIQQLWLNANKNFAETLSWLDKIFSKTQAIADIKPSNPEDSIWTKMGDYFGGKDMPGRMNDADRQFEVAKQRLASQLGNSSNVTRGREESQRADDWRMPDQSSPAPALAAEKKAREELNDAVDRAINGLQKHVLAQKADADGIGLGAAALAGFKAQASETAAVLANGGKETDAQKEAFSKLKVEASAAADALARAQVASEISRGKQLLFATPEDVKIANELKGIYGDDIPKALQSAEAAAIRMNDSVKGIVDNFRGALTSGVQQFVAGLVQGKSLMESLGSAARSLSTTLTNQAITEAFKGNFVGAAASGIGAIITGIFGASEQEDEDNRKKAQAAADAAKKAIEDATQRTKQYNALADSSKFDTSTVLGQIAQFDAQAMQTRADEAEKGNGAIVALELSLAKQRQAIVDKGNQAIAKSMTDFLNSIKTGASSILSPEDQLKYAQSRFSGDVAAGQGGDEAALNRVTADAQNLLDIAKAFYASGTGYATIYQGVTDAISGLAGQSNIKVGALAANTAQAPYDPVAAAQANLLRAQTAIAAAPPEQGLAEGGYVGNGRYGVDSVMAKFAGGGNIALAGGEHVTRSNSVNASTRPALDYINRTGRTPGNEELARILTQGFNGQTQVLADRLDALAQSVKQLENTTRQTNNKRRVPGSEKVAA